MMMPSGPRRKQSRWMSSYCAISPTSSAPWTRKRATTSSMSSTANMMRRMPSAFPGALSGSALPGDARPLLDALGGEPAGGSGDRERRVHVVGTLGDAHPDRADLHVALVVGDRVAGLPHLGQRSLELGAGHPRAVRGHGEDLVRVEP